MPYKGSSALLLMILAVVPVWAQSEATSAQLSGTVQDENGATVPGAKVTLANPEVNFTRELTTGDNGLYTFTLNPPGSQGNVDQDIAFFNFGGGRFGTTAFLLDGAWDGAGDWDGVIYVPSVDELQEFRIQTNTFSPQYGLSMGNVVNAVTKSGTR